MIMNKNINSNIGRGRGICIFFLSVIAILLNNIEVVKANTLNIGVSGDVAASEIVMVETQDDDYIVVTGKVVDADRNPILQASIRVMGTRIKVTTNEEGFFSIKVPVGEILEVTAAGYSVKEIDVMRDTNNILVNLDIQKDDMVDPQSVAYGFQERARVVGAISSTKGSQLITSNSNLTPALVGNIAGVIGWQNHGSPGILTDDRVNSEFYIRGVRSMIDGMDVKPLIIMDGIEISELDLARINPIDIDDVSILKDASATTLYGVRGANGVVVITSKRSAPGEINISATYENVIAQPTMEVEFADPVTYMKLYNTSMINGNNPYVSLYSNDKIERTASGDFPSYAYPANDWTEQLFTSKTNNSRLNVNVSGGTKTIQYYTSFTMNDDMGMIKSDDLSVFNANIDNKMMSFRANMVANLNKGIKLTVNSYTTIDEYNGPMYISEYEEGERGYIGDAIYKLAYAANPVNYAMVYPTDDKYTWEHIRFGHAGTMTDNPYMRIHEGFTTADRYFTVNKFSYEQELNFLTEGLRFGASVIFQKESYASKRFYIVPATYSLDDSYYSTNVYSIRQTNSDYVKSFPLYEDLSSVNTSLSGTDYELQLMYDRTFGDHSVSAFGIYDVQEYKNKNPNNIDDSSSLMYKNSAVRVGYGYKNRYFIEGSYAESGNKRLSDSYLISKSFSIGAAYLLSEEEFIKNNFSFVDLFKVRASFGDVHNNNKVEGYEMQWSIPNMYNIGADIRLFDGLQVNFDYFAEKRRTQLFPHTVILDTDDLGNVLDSEDIPGNIIKTKTNGYELSVNYTKAFRKDFWVVIGGNLSYNKSVYDYLESEELVKPLEHQSLIGHDISQVSGYIANGIFSDVAEIDRSPKYGSQTEPGDIRYRDIYDDYVINNLDMLPIGLPTVPRYTYGVNGAVHFKGVEFSFSFQGVGERSFFVDPHMFTPFIEDGYGVLQAIADSHWSPTNMVDQSFWPRINVNTIGAGAVDGGYQPADLPTSTFFMYNGAYLRCRHIELSYSLPSSLINKLGLKRVKIYGRTDNPFVISDFKFWDPELGTNALNYPILKSYSLGISLSF